VNGKDFVGLTVALAFSALCDAHCIFSNAIVRKEHLGWA
jgi:hypothetical protein